MKILKEPSKPNLPSLETYLENQTYYYGIGEKVIITQWIDGEGCYGVDTIREIVITEDAITYYFNESHLGVSQDDIIPYTIENENILLNNGYNFVYPYSLY